MCANRKPLAYSRLENDREFRPRLLKHPGLSVTELSQVQIANGYWLDQIGDAQTPPCQRRRVWEDE